ncbi:MAG: hypothetical protein E7184_01530 [Erysipelotrichaceae bacterium]|nr:hypothetical protein [Erysipelotrichaceae bacterium]
MSEYEKIALKSKIDQFSVFNCDKNRKKEFLNEACIAIGYQMKNCNPIQLSFSPMHLSFNTIDTIILPESFLTDYDLVSSVIYLSNVYYLKRIANAYQSNDSTSNLFSLVEKKIDISGSEKSNLRNLKNVALSASYNFTAKQLLSEFYVSKYMNGEFAKKLENDPYINSCAKMALQSYKEYHKQ